MDYSKLPLLQRPVGQLLIKILDLEFQEYKFHLHSTDSNSYKIVCTGDKCTLCQLAKKMGEANDKKWTKLMARSAHILPVEVYPNVSDIEEGEYRWEFGISLFKAYSGLLERIDELGLIAEEIFFTFDVSYKHEYPVYDKCYFTINNIKFYVDELRRVVDKPLLY